MFDNWLKDESWKTERQKAQSAQFNTLSKHRSFLHDPVTYLLSLELYFLAINVHLAEIILVCNLFINFNAVNMWECEIFALSAHTVECVLKKSYVKF